MNAQTLDKLEEVLKQNLEADIIALLAQRLQLDAETAIDLYYASELARQVDEGTFGIQYLSPQYLADDLIENEGKLIDRLL